MITEEEQAVIEEEAVAQNNNPPRFTFDPETTYVMESMYQEWMDLNEGVIAESSNEFTYEFLLPSVIDVEGDAITVEVFLPALYVNIIQVEDLGLTKRIIVDMDELYALAIQSTDEQEISLTVLIAVLDEDNNDPSNPDFDNVYETTFLFRERGPWNAPIPEAPEEEVFNAPIVLTRDIDIRIAQPVAIVSYGNIEEEFVREEPIVNDLKIDANGNLKMEFSNEMDWPENWVEASQSRRNLEMRNLAAAQPFIRIGILTSDGEFSSMGSDALEITSIDEKSVDMKINFENPEIMSLGS